MPLSRFNAIHQLVFLFGVSFEYPHRVLRRDLVMGCMKRLAIP